MRRARSAHRSSSIDAAIFFLVALSVTAAGKPKPAVDPAVEAERLARENAVYRKQLDLAAGESFYYLLDPKTKSLRFLYQGNLLREYPLLDVEVGTRRGFFGSGAPPSDWAQRVWEEGELDPPRQGLRVELDTAAEDYEEQRQATLVPPTPEEAYPAPELWRIRYLKGLTLEVHGLADSTRTRPGFLPGIGRWFSDAVHGLGPGGKDEVRIRIYLPRARADELYRSVPPDTRFTVLHAR